MKDYKDIIKNCIECTADNCKHCHYTGKGCTVKLLEDLLIHLEVKDGIIECMNITHNGDVHTIHNLRMENVALKCEAERVTHSKLIEARLEGAKDYVKQLKTKIYGYDALHSTQSIYYTMNKLLKEWEENTNE